MCSYPHLNLTQVHCTDLKTGGSNEPVADVRAIDAAIDVLTLATWNVGDVRIGAGDPACFGTGLAELSMNAPALVHPQR